MLRPLSDDDRDEFRRFLARPLRGVVRDAARIDEPAELERLAARLVPVELGTLGPPGALAEFIGLVGEQKGGRSLLHAISAAAPPPLSALAAEALSQLGDGPLTVAAQKAGTLVPERAFEVDGDEPVTCVLLVCRRPAVEGIEVVGVTLEWPLTGGAIKDGLSGADIPERELEELLLDPFRKDGVEPEEISIDDAIDLVAAGAARNAESRLGPTADGLLAATLLLRAARRGDADELLEPLVSMPALADVLGDGLDKDDEPELDEEALGAEIELFDAALDGWCAGRGYDDDWAGLVTYAGHAMADFRARYGEDDPSVSESAALSEFLLDFAPRKLGFESGELERFPQAVAEVFRFLGATGQMPPDEADKLAEAALSAADQFVERAKDPQNFGLAKAMTTAMVEDGVDLSDQAAVNRWIADYNSLPQDERHRRVPAFARPSFFSPSASTPQAVPRNRRSTSKARKAQRQARKRNRRH